MTPNKQLLDAEQHFTELAKQLGQLKLAAEAIENSGVATSQMSLLAESALNTANNLSVKMDEFIGFLEQQNIPSFLSEYEVRTNGKFEACSIQLADLKSEIGTLLGNQEETLQIIIGLAEENATSVDTLQEKTGLLQQQCDDSANSAKNFKRLTLLFQAAMAAAIAYLIYHTSK